MRMVQIEKNIPIPAPKKKECKYPFHKMEVGDSFFYPLKDECSTALLQMKISNASCTYNRKDKTGKKFKTTQLSNGVRVWRIQ
ncbi:MAG: hypothetical protein RSE15_05045 [Flavobacterium sp.]|uniref:DUF7303 family protein n=1 Tax=Flavobacterium sp. TaxID=239 RepID=UPI002B4A266D|nr:hypothetical protein [Flavobacterium sp.]WRH74196.1 MAG: hypothetical protein RSE15_05045 [Flavobacterium sp.]